MSARLVMATYRAAERIAAPAMERGYCRTRAEYRAVSAVYRHCSRWYSAWYAQQKKKAWAALPHEGPGALAYFRAVSYPAIVRSHDRWVRLHGQPGRASSSAASTRTRA